MMLELCPFCKMPKRKEQTITQNESMIFYECGTTEILKTTKSQFSGTNHSRETYSQKSACREICRLRNTIDVMRHKDDA